MASRNRTARRTTVPVSSRDAQAKKRTRPRPKPQRLDMVGVGVLIIVILVVLMTIAVPLRNYYQGRTEIARLNESIAAKEDERARLIGEIERYEDEDYVRQEARRRLGVIEPGETAYRIVDPRMQSEESLTTPSDEAEPARTWYETLWDAVAEPPNRTTAP